MKVWVTPPSKPLKAAELIADGERNLNLIVQVRENEYDL